MPGWGWRWPWPIETVNKVNVASVNSSDFKSRVLTSDVNLVDLHFSVQYQFTDPVKIALQRARSRDDTLSEVSESAIREIVGRSTLDDVLVGRHAPGDHPAHQGAHPAARSTTTTPASPSPPSISRTCRCPTR